MRPTKIRVARPTPVPDPVAEVEAAAVPPVWSDFYTRSNFAERLRVAYRPYLTVTVFPDQDRLDIQDLRPDGPGPDAQPYTLAAAMAAYPLTPSPTLTPQPSSADPPAGADSWRRFQQTQARKAEAERTINPQLPFLQTLVAPWHARGWDVELPEEVRLLGENWERANLMGADWRLLQEARGELDLRRGQSDALRDADQALAQCEKGITLPAERLQPLGHALKVNLEPSRSGAEFVSPPECCRRMRKRLEAAMAEAATKAESVGAPVAPPPRVLRPELGPAPTGGGRAITAFDVFNPRGEVR
jgi:hypothetical protein